MRLLEIIMLRRFSAAVLIAGLVASGCESKHQPSTSGPMVAAPAQSFDLWLCTIKPVLLVEKTKDGKLGVGDAISYEATLAKQPACRKADQTIAFNGVEEIVQQLKPTVTGDARFLSNFQGTLKFAEGDLQLRGLQSFRVPAVLLKQLVAGTAPLQVIDVLPESSTFTVVGGGDQFSGMVGNISYVMKPGTGLQQLKVLLYRQVQR